MGLLEQTVLDRELGGGSSIAEAGQQQGVPRSNPLHLRGHVTPLDGLRGLAIVLVLLVHFTPEGQSHTFVGGLMKSVAGAGVTGVDLFFVLSGFLITGILLDAKGKAGYLRTFYARRALRIFPLYYLVLVLCLVVAPRVMRMDSPEYREFFAKQGWLWFYVGNIKTAMGTAVCPFSAGWLQFDHFWSLAIEEQFYLVWPLLVLLLSRRGMMGVCGALMAGALVLRWWLYAKGDPTMAFYTFTPCRIDALATGGLLALAARRQETAAWVMKVAPAVFVVTGTVLVSIWGGNFCGYVIGGTLLEVFFAALLVLVVAGGTRSVWRRVFDWPVMRVFGRYSYAMYVLHPFLMAGVMSRISYTWLGKVTHSGPVGVVLYLGIGFGLTLGAGWVSWNVCERHFLKLKRFFEYEKAGR